MAVAAVALLLPALGDSSRGVSYARDVQPIFDQKCASCHPAAYPYLDLRPGRSYPQLVGISPPNAPSYERVVPGHPELSYLLIHPPDPSRRTLLTPSERRVIAEWIMQGAKNN